MYLNIGVLGQKYSSTVLEYSNPDANLFFIIIFFYHIQNVLLINYYIILENLGKYLHICANMFLPYAKCVVFFLYI